MLKNTKVPITSKNDADLWNNQGSNRTKKIEKLSQKRKEGKTLPASVLATGVTANMEIKRAVFMLKAL